MIKNIFITILSLGLLILYLLLMSHCSDIIRNENKSQKLSKIIYRTIEITLPNGDKDWVLRPFDEETLKPIENYLPV